MSTTTSAPQVQAHSTHAGTGVRPERLYSLAELHEAGYGSRRTIAARIREGKLPALKIGNAFKIRESHIHLLGDDPAEVHADAGCEVPAPAAEVGLGGYLAALAAAYPALDGNQKEQLWRLLSSAA